jgi:hypothetical protein
MHAHDYAGSLEGLDNWIETMDKAGIEKTIILCRQHGMKFDSVLEVYSRYHDRFEDPGFPAAALEELERCFEKGAKGVGELGDKGKGMFFSRPAAPGMHPDDPRMDALWEKCL